MSAGRGIAAVLILAVVMTGCRFEHPPMHAESPPGSWYVVRAGDTWESISRQSGTPVEDILELNGLGRAGAAKAGQVVYLLDSRSTMAMPVAASAPSGAPQPPAGRETLRWPLASPVVSSPFGVRGSRPHEGIDLAAATGTPVLAADAGEVIYAGDGIRGYGNLVVIQHGSGLLTVYAHNSALVVKQGDRVTAGQRIAFVGQSGRATAPHLHFEVREGQIPRDPMRYLPRP